MNKKFRVALGQIPSKSNHFVSSSCDLDFFRTTGYLRGGEDIFGLGPTDTEVGGL